ncbi:MAG: hypothetical protein QOH74_1342 [Gaiellales bacterium]|nr:hypothetical protein [Gaiellales bacterium]
MAGRIRQRDRFEPRADYGFFGPDSVAWRLWSYPTSLTVGFQRSVVIEELDPALNAAVEATKAIRYRPRTRYERTIVYFALAAFGDSQSAVRAADVLVKVHSKGVGTDPVTGISYDANDPQSQLWILLTAWHSILYAYEKYGPGRLPEQDETEYWNACAVAAELQTCDPADVPRTRDGIREYFEAMRPQLLGSDVAQSTMDHLLHAEVMFPPLPRALRPAGWVVARVLRAATIATMPHWMREMSGLRQWRTTDALVVPVMWTAMRAAKLSRFAQLQILRAIAPGVLPIAGPVLYGVPPLRPEVVGPAAAREIGGYTAPAQAHPQWRARQRELVFGEGQVPSDEGIYESEAVLGPIA